MSVNIAPGNVLVDGKPAPGLALHGYDPVAFFTESKPVQGSSSFAAVHNGATYRFSSQANLDVFKANPSQYEPGFGGFCAYGISLGAKFDGDPRFWSIVDNKLYVNLDQGIADAFNKDVPGALAKANANWPTLA